MAMTGSDPAISPLEFGCADCWPPDADRAWRARGALAQVAELVDDSHLGIRILACRRCTQRFLSVFEEEIDWVDGDDPQYWTLLPLTADEAVRLLASGDSVTRNELNALGQGRRSLHRHHPKGEEPRIFWQGDVSLP